MSESKMDAGTYESKRVQLDVDAFSFAYSAVGRLLQREFMAGFERVRLPANLTIVEEDGSLVIRFEWDELKAERVIDLSLLKEGEE